jgi:hypothetical protein
LHSEADEDAVKVTSLPFDAPLSQLDVRRLEIAMDDALLVRRFERVGDLSCDRQRLVEWMP